MERTNAEGNPSEDPTRYLDLDDVDGVVLDRTMVERIQPDSLHGQETMEEDDNFESIGTEVWEYDVADGKDKDFIDALKNSKMVMEYEAIGDSDASGSGRTP